MLGRRFDEGLFRAILSLTAEEIDTPLEKLSIQTKLNMCKALLEANLDAGMDLDYLKKRVAWLENFDQLNDQAILEAAESVHLANCLPQHFTVNNQDDDPDLDKIKQNKGEFKTFLSAALLSQVGVHGQFAAQLAPIQEIARGMKSICGCTLQTSRNNDHWDTTIRRVAYQEFSNAIQGLLDRNKIAKQIELKNRMYPANTKSEIEKKINWLQEWIKDKENGATEQELKTLLKFLTGASSLPKDKTISVGAQGRPYYPVPIAHTCTLSMDLSPEPCKYLTYNDHTKEDFIKSIKELAFKNSPGFQMG